MTVNSERGAEGFFLPNCLLYPDHLHTIYNAFEEAVTGMADWKDRAHCLQGTYAGGGGDGRGGGTCGGGGGGRDHDDHNDDDSDNDGDYDDECAWLLRLCWC